MNRRQFNLTIGTVVGQAAIPAVALAARRLPDLIVTAVRWSDDHGITFHSGAVLSGGQLMFQADVKNIGTAGWSPRVVLGVAFRVNGAMAAWSDTHRDGLAPGATVTLTSNGGPDGDAFWVVGEPGSYTVRVMADDINRARELNDSNNTREVTLLVEPADEPLVANDDTLETAVDTSAEVDVLANDQGPSDMRVTSVQSPTAQGGQVAVLEDGRTIRYTPPPGFSGADEFTYEVTAMSAISGAAVTATASVRAAVGALPDLIVTAARWSDDDGQTWNALSEVIPAGADVLFEADVTNQGAGATPDGVVLGVSFRINGVSVSWSDTHTTALNASQSVTLQANGGPDGGAHWNNVQAGDYPFVAFVDDVNRIVESNETNNQLSASLNVEGSAQQSQVTMSDRTGGANIFVGEATSFKLTDLQTLHCKMCRIAMFFNSYNANQTPSPQNFDAVIVSLLQKDIRPQPQFELYSSESGGNAPARTYAKWQSLGSAFAARFKPNSTFLVSQGLTDIGVERWGALNEPDILQGFSTAEYHAMLEGLADGIHSQHADAKVFPGGYADPSRSSNFTARGYLPAVADLINDGTLAGFDLHTYHDKSFCRIYDTYARSHQAAYDGCIAASGITKLDIDWSTTEHSVKAEPIAADQNYASTYPGTGLTHEQVARNWYLTHFFDVHGAVRSDGSLAPGIHITWNLWQYSGQQYWFASQTQPRVERQCGLTFSMIMNIVHDMHFTSNDPKGTGVYKLKGGGKSVWVFQNIHTSWTNLFGNSFTISDIPAATTQVQVYDGNGVFQTVSTPTLQKPSHTFTNLRPNFPANMGKTVMFVGNAE